MKQLRSLLRMVLKMWNKETGGGVQSAPLPISHETVQSPPESVNSADVRSLIDLQLVKSNYYKDQILRADRTDAHPDIVRFYNRLRVELERRGIPFYAHQFYRGKAEQDRLKAAGRSKAAWGSSPHNYGLAVDMVHALYHWDLTKAQWALIGTIGKEVARKLDLKVTWGGDWNFYDPAHWQLTNWKNLKGWKTTPL